MKPMLASDFLEEKLKFPLIAQPKIDGVRALHTTGSFTGRSLKKFKNVHTSNFYNHSALAGLDGELAADRETHPDLCRITSSAVGTIKGEPYTLWWLFDYVTPETAHLPYFHRFDEQLPKRLDAIRDEAPEIWHHLRLMPFKLVTSFEQLLEYENECLLAGFEGVGIRGLKAKHKQGRSTPTEGGLQRIKRFVDFEFKAHTILEGEENQNEAQINELGNTFRSSHQENKVANGMIGAILGTTLDVVKDPTTGAVLFEKGAEVQVSAGCLNHSERRHYFLNQADFFARTHKGKFFPKGIKDKPRFPTWQSFRDSVDIS
jgi:DNA ligase-1